MTEPGRSPDVQSPPAWMWVVVGLLAAWVALASLCKLAKCAEPGLVPVQAGHCPNGVCPVDPGFQGWQPYSGDPWQVQPQAAPQSSELRVTPIEPQQPWSDARIVKIRNYAGNGRFCFLSGSVVAIDGDPSYVLMCAHGLAGKGDPVVVIFNDGHSYDVGTVVDTDSGDVALLKLRSPRSEFFYIASQEPQSGETVYLFGFPESAAFRSRTGIYELENTVQFRIGGVGIPGESGGAVVNTSGLIVGVITETDSGRRGGLTFGPRLHCIRRLLDAIFPNRPGRIIPRASTPAPDQMPASPQEKKIVPPVAVEEPVVPPPVELPILPVPKDEFPPIGESPDAGSIGGKIGTAVGTVAVSTLGLSGGAATLAGLAFWYLGKRAGKKLRARVEPRVASAGSGGPADDGQFRADPASNTSSRNRHPAAQTGCFHQYELRSV